MEPDPKGRLLKEASKQLERARVADIDLRTGFPQVTISNSSSQQRDLIKTFSSPLPGVHEVDCHNCARYKVRMAELQAKLIERKQGTQKANSQ